MFSNSSYECDSLPVIPPSLRASNDCYSQGVMAIVGAVLGLPLNIFLLVIIVKFKSLHQSSYMLILQIIIAGILYYLVIPPATNIHGRWILGDVACNVFGMVHDA